MGGGPGERRKEGYKGKTNTTVSTAERSGYPGFPPGMLSEPLKKEVVLMLKLLTNRISSLGFISFKHIGIFRCMFWHDRG